MTARLETRSQTAPSPSRNLGGAAGFQKLSLDFIVYVDCLFFLEVRPVFKKAVWICFICLCLRYMLWLRWYDKNGGDGMLGGAAGSQKNSVWICLFVRCMFGMNLVSLSSVWKNVPRPWEI